MWGGSGGDATGDSRDGLSRSGEEGGALASSLLRVCGPPGRDEGGPGAGGHT